MNNLFASNQIIKLLSIDSTNNYAMNLLKKNELFEGNIIWAMEQTKGKGQHGSSWESKKGKNLTFSLITQPGFIKIDEQFLLSETISLAISDVLKTLVANVSIKWPNDIYVNNDKIAGILIENILKADRIEKSVVGIGFNVNQTNFGKNTVNAISLKMITGKSFKLENILHLLCASIEKRYLQLKNAGKHEINEEYLKRLYLLKVAHEFKYPNGNTFIGKIIGVRDSGRLIVETAEQERKEFYFKEIVF